MISSRKIFIISGETSGDLHAANLVYELKKIDSNILFFGWGGDRMISEGVHVKKHISELAFMGFVEVFLNLRTIIRNFKLCKSQIIDFNPDFIILIDYPGFNLRIAKWAHKKGIKVVYYISPQIWAWKQSRVFQIKKYVSKMYCILPFEKEFYKQFDIDVEYCGHPLLDEINRFNEIAENKLQFENPVLAILPGSRKQEIERKLPIMLNAAKNFSNFEIVVACAPNLNIEFYQKYSSENVQFIKNQTYKLLNCASVALVTSGTATLETALFRVPQVVCYKSSNISFFIAKLLVKIKYISLVNLILDKLVVKELIQNDCNEENIVFELNQIVEGGIERKRILEDYDELIKKLGENGSSKRAAKKIWIEFGDELAND